MTLLCNGNGACWRAWYQFKSLVSLSLCLTHTANKALFFYWLVVLWFFGFFGFLFCFAFSFFFFPQHRAKETCIVNVYHESCLLRPLQEHKLDFKSVLLNRTYPRTYPNCAAAPRMQKCRKGRTGVSLPQPPTAVGVHPMPHE